MGNPRRVGVWASNLANFHAIIRVNKSPGLPRNFQVGITWHTKRESPVKDLCTSDATLWSSCKQHVVQNTFYWKSQWNCTLSLTSLHQGVGCLSLWGGCSLHHHLDIKTRSPPPKNWQLFTLLPGSPFILSASCALKTYTPQTLTVRWQRTSHDRDTESWMQLSFTSQTNHVLIIKLQELYSLHLSNLYFW